MGSKINSFQRKGDVNAITFSYHLNYIIPLCFAQIHQVKSQKNLFVLDANIGTSGTTSINFFPLRQPLKQIIAKNVALPSKFVEFVRFYQNFMISNIFQGNVKNCESGYYKYILVLKASPTLT